MRKVIYFIFFLVTFLVIFSSSVKAVCPVCTVAIGGGVLLSRYLGVDDLVIGVWVGGLVLSFGLWMASYLKKTFFKGQKWFITTFLWIATVFSLKQVGFIGHPYCKIYGRDKLLSGIVLGTLAFLLGYGLDYFLRKLNKKEPGKALFSYQRVVCPLSFLILATILSLELCNLI